MAPLAPLAGPLILGGAGIYAASKMKSSKSKSMVADPIEAARVKDEASRKQRQLLASRRGMSDSILGGDVGDNELMGKSLLGA